MQYNEGKFPLPEICTILIWLLRTCTCTTRDKGVWSLPFHLLPSLPSSPSLLLTSSNPIRLVGVSAEGENILMSWSSPLVARTGMWGCGSKQFTCIQFIHVHVRTQTSVYNVFINVSYKRRCFIQGDGKIPPSRNSPPSPKQNYSIESRRNYDKNC